MGFRCAIRFAYEGDCASQCGRECRGEAKRVIDPLIRGTGVEFMPEGISDIGDNEDIDSIVKKYRIVNGDSGIKFSEGDILRGGM